MLPFTRFAKVFYLLALALVLCLLVLPSLSQGQTGFGVSTGYRATPGLPTIAIALPNISGGGVGGSVGGGASGFGGGAGGGFGGVSFNSQPIIMHINLGQFFPNNGQIIGLPPPTMTPMLNNFGPLVALFGPAGLLPTLASPYANTSDSTGAPWALMTAMGGGGGVGGGGMGGIGGGGIGGIAGGGVGGIAGGGVGGIAGGGVGGIAGGGLGGNIGGGVGGFNAGQGGFGGGGMTGFAGKGFGGFNGRKPL